MKRAYYVFSNGRLLRKQNTVYLYQYDGEREDGDEQSLADAAQQNGCVLEDFDELNDDESNEEVLGGKSLVEDELSAVSSGEELSTEEQSPVTAFPDDSSPSLPESSTTNSSSIEACPPNSSPIDATATDSTSMTPNASDEHDSQRRVLHKRPVPIEDVEAFYLFGETDLNTKLLNFLARHRVPVHVFNYFGFYSSTITPRQEVNSGFLLVKQCAHHSTPKLRMAVARAFVDGASFNILKNLKYYGSPSRGRDLSATIAAVETERLKIMTARDISTLMGIEGHIRALYYSAWPQIFSQLWVEFTKRVKRPPDNPINALVSFGNSMCYTLALSEIYRTPLSPLVSFLHEPGARRYSLSLDMAEIFKPILCDRLIFKLINNGELQPKHFDEKLNFCYLKESGRKIFVEQWQERLKTTIEHRGLGRKVSYQRLVRLECYKLQKHLMNIERYEPFKIWW